MESDIIARIDKALSDCEIAGWEDVPFPEGLLMECKEEIIAASLRWIPVEERLPEEDCLVLWYCPDERWPVTSGRFCRPHHVDVGGDLAVPFSEGRYTHWLPLPEPPAQ